MCSSSGLSQMFLYGDLSRLGVIALPTEKEMASLVVRINSGAMKGLEKLGFRRSEVQIMKAIVYLKDTLNRTLPGDVKALFHGGGGWSVRFRACFVQVLAERNT